MPAIATEENLSTGECGQPGTLPIGPFSSSTCTFGGKRLQFRGITVYNNHPTIVPHSGLRTVKAIQATPSTMFFEGNPVAFVGDLLDDNDKIKAVEGSTFFGG
jgi:hypothetical protein